MVWVWCSTVAFTVGLDVEEGRITKAPPICRYAIGKSASWYKRYLASRGILLRWVEFEEE